MELRSHPGMIYRGMANWPPVWTKRDGNSTMRGEIGVLKYVYANDRVSNKCYLVIDYENMRYVGCLIFNDHSFCTEVSKVLRHHLGRSIKEIGGLDLSHTL